MEETSRLLSGGGNARTAMCMVAALGLLAVYGLALQTQRNAVAVCHLDNPADRPVAWLSSVVCAKQPAARTLICSPLRLATVMGSRLSSLAA